MEDRVKKAGRDILLGKMIQKYEEKKKAVEMIRH